MFKYNCLNPISDCGLDRFTDMYEKTDDAANADAILVRSASMHDMEVAPSVKAVARAGAGVNNIPLEAMAEKGIVVFNTPGANANGVKELVVAGMLLASRDIVGGIEWVKEHADSETIGKDVEKAKKAFAGSELKGKKLGVIGLGAIGVLVANVGIRLKMEVYGYDPYLSVDAAWNLSRSVKHVTSPEEIYENCDFITVHVPALDATKGMINKDTIAMMKDGVKIMNFARDVLVNDDDILEALESGKVAKYVTDFPNPKVVKAKNVIAIPHLGASTEESEDNCAIMAVDELKDYLENGNIKNSVNYPNCDMGTPSTVARIAIHHKNIPNMLGQLTSFMAKEDVNIPNLTNKSRGKFAYTLMDADSVPSKQVLEDLRAINGVLRVRVIK